MCAVFNCKDSFVNLLENSKFSTSEFFQFCFMNLQNFKDNEMVSFE
jgi:hypothetical protein